MRGRALIVLVPTLAGLFVGGASARGQTADPAATPTTTTIPNLLVDLLTKLAPTTTTVPPPPPPPPPPPAPTPLPAAASGPAQPGQSAEAAGSHEIPPEYQEIINSVRRSGPRNTDALIAALSPLRELGMTTQQIAEVGFGAFPIAGETSFVDDWLFPRFNPTFHLHKGTDLFADLGTPIRAPAPGVVRFTTDGVGGKSTYLVTADRTQYYMTHLDDWPTDIASGSSVAVGDIIGFVGNTGNAAGGSPHLHLEIRPKGGPQVNPKPILDGWLNDALAAAPEVLQAYNLNVPSAVSSASILRRIDRGSVFAGAPDQPDILLASAGGANGLVQLSERETWARNEELARVVLAPMTPKPLDAFLNPSPAHVH